MINQNRGWGILALVIIVAFVLIVQGAVGAISGDPHFYKLHAWPMGVAVLLAAAVVYLVVRHFSKEPRRAMTEATKRVLTIWVFVLAVAGVVLLFVRLG
jgi:nitrate reductase gamma subunit